LNGEERILKEVNYQMLLVSDDIEDLLNQKKLCSAYNRKVDYYRNDLRIKKQYIATYW
jgi:hypothetical protein